MIKLLARALLTALFLAGAGVSLGADVLRRGLGPEPDSLDIHQAQGLAALQVLRDTHEGLLTFDAAGEVAPGVAESWQVSADGLHYRFTLRADARWSNGDQLLAEDFVRGWQAALAPASQARTAALLEPIRHAAAIMRGAQDPLALGVRAEGERLLLVELERPTPWLLELLAHPVAFPLHRAATSDISKRPVNGAFVVSEAVPHGHIRLSPNSHFHAADSVQLAGVDYLPIEDAGSELARYRAGELHITETIPPGRFQWLQVQLPQELHIAPYLGSFWLGINLRRAPLGDSADLRRALSLALDRATLVRVVTGAGELPAWGVVPPGIGGFRPPADPAADLADGERQAEARRLFEKAGYGPQRPLDVQLRFNTSSQHRRLAVAVAAMWKQVLGVNTELLHEEWKVFVNNRRQGVVTQVFRGGWIADYADPTSFLDLFAGGAELNTTFYDNRQYDQLLLKAAGASGSQRLHLVEQAEALLMRDTPVIPLYYYVSRHLVKPSVRGYQDNPRDVHLSRYLSIAAETP
jgi:ABC-type oligopeptide transport system substrate-binding subunit